MFFGGGLCLYMNVGGGYVGLTVALVNCAHVFNGKFVETYNLHINDVTYCGILGFIYRGNQMILIIQLNLAILDELINNKSPFL